MLPRLTTISTAAVLLGRSPKAVRQLVNDGLLPEVRAGYWSKIKIADIAKFRGSPIDPIEYMRAVESRVRQLEYYRAYQAARRKNENGSGVVTAP